MLSANCHYSLILQDLKAKGDRIITRNSPSFSLFDYSNITFHHTPLVTIRKTAWKKALKEMEWFMSGESECPEELMDWWKGQLNPSNEYVGGYGEQMRKHGMNACDNPIQSGFDQVRAILQSLKEHKYGRRHIMTTWEPFTMNHITAINGNTQTPTTCHGTLTQFFVRYQTLHMKTYQRSADILLGVPHNWIQYWALLLYFAYHSRLKPGKLVWMFGDLHLYDEASHIDACNAILNCNPYEVSQSFYLEYYPSDETIMNCPAFLAEDFLMEGAVPAPQVLIRPKLLA